MATVPTSTARVDVDPTFERMLEMLRDAAQRNALAMSNGAAPVWHMPAGWPGNLDDWEAITKAFDRSELNTKTAEALSSASNPGTAGDTIIGPLQIDYLACAARAMHARYASKPRRLMLATARLKGQGDVNGVFKGSILEFISNTAKRSKTKGKS
jgi:hypothetical protein